MKKLELIVGLFTLQLLLGPLAWSADRQIDISVKGMVCSFCAQGITKKFSSHDAVKKVDVNLEEHRVTLSIRDGKDMTDEQITEMLMDSGYTVEKIGRK